MTKKHAFMQRKNVFLLEIITFVFFFNISYKIYESSYIWFESVSNSLSK